LTENAAISLAVAILLALQIFSVGFTSGAMAKGGDVFGVVCATDKASPTNSNPSSPVSHHVDMCCVLHSSAAVEPDAPRSPPGLLSKEAPPVLPAPTFDIDAICADPELRPLSPRAPPARSV
jgi:hypothetical protein